MDVLTVAGTPRGPPAAGRDSRSASKLRTKEKELTGRASHTHTCKGLGGAWGEGQADGAKAPAEAGEPEVSWEARRGRSKTCSDRLVLNPNGQWTP